MMSKFKCTVSGESCTESYNDCLCDTCKFYNIMRKMVVYLRDGVKAGAKEEELVFALDDVVGVCYNEMIGLLADSYIKSLVQNVKPPDPIFYATKISYV